MYDLHRTYIYYLKKHIHIHAKKKYEDLKGKNEKGKEKQRKITLKKKWGKGLKNPCFVL